MDWTDGTDDTFPVYPWDGDGNEVNESTMLLCMTISDGDTSMEDALRAETYAYTARGRLAQAVIDSDGDEDTDVMTTYTYDDHGIRVRQVVERAGQPTSVTEFVVDHQNATGYAQTIEEHSREGTTPTPTPTRQVAYTIGLDEIVQAVKDNPTASAVVSQFLHDGRGSVRQLADAIAELVTAATQGMAEVLKLDYSAYGTAVNYAAETVATALLHNGEFVDPVTGQQYLRARWYDQATGRFNRVDPFAGEGSVPQSLHKYTMGHADPLSHTDPTGAVAHLLWGALFGSTALGLGFAAAEASFGGSLSDIWKAGVNGIFAGAGLGFVTAWQYTTPAGKTPLIAFDITNIAFSAVLTGLAYAITEVAVDVDKGQLQPVGKYFVEFTRGFSEGVFAETLDQANPFKSNRLVSTAIQIIGPSIVDFVTQIWYVQGDMSKIDWKQVKHGFVQSTVVALLTQQETAQWIATRLFRSRPGQADAELVARLEYAGGLLFSSIASFFDKKVL